VWDREARRWSAVGRPVAIPPRAARALEREVFERVFGYLIAPNVDVARLTHE